MPRRWESYMAKKTFNEKLRFSGDLPKLETMTSPRHLRAYGPGKMLIAPPIFYDRMMKRVPEGRLTTVDRIRAALAREHGADVTCPLTAGIFVNIVANASVERDGEDPTPYWRTLKQGGVLNEKFPGGVELQKGLLEAEGHVVVQRGKKHLVEGYETALWKGI